MDPEEERLSNLIQDIPALQNPIAEYLAHQEDDSRIEGRLKNSLESVLFDTTLAAGMFTVLKATKNSRKVTNAVKEARKSAEADVQAAASPGKGEPLKVKPEKLQEAFTPQGKEFAEVNPETFVGSPDESVKVNMSKFLSKDLADRNVKKFFAENADAINQVKRGSQTIEEIEAGAEAILQSDDQVMQLLKRNKGEVFNAEQMFAARMLLRSASKEVESAANLAVKGDPADLAKFKESLDQYNVMLANL